MRVLSVPIFVLVVVALVGGKAVQPQYLDAVIAGCIFDTSDVNFSPWTASLSIARISYNGDVAAAVEILATWNLTKESVHSSPWDCPFYYQVAPTVFTTDAQYYAYVTTTPPLNSIYLIDRKALTIKVIPLASNQWFSGFTMATLFKSTATDVLAMFGVGPYAGSPPWSDRNMVGILDFSTANFTFIERSPFSDFPLQGYATQDTAFFVGQWRGTGWNPVQAVWEYDLQKQELKALGKNCTKNCAYFGDCQSGSTDDKVQCYVYFPEENSCPGEYTDSGYSFITITPDEPLKNLTLVKPKGASCITQDSSWNNHTLYFNSEGQCIQGAGWLNGFTEDGYMLLMGSCSINNYHFWAYWIDMESGDPVAAVDMNTFLQNHFKYANTEWTVASVLPPL